MMMNRLQILRWNPNFGNRVVKWDGKSPSKFELKSNFLKQWQNVTANCLQRLRLRLLNISEISKRCCILHLHHQWNSEILCKFFALGLHTLNSRQQIAGTYKIKLTQAEFKGWGVPSQSQFFAIFYCIEHYSAISRYKQTIFQWNQYDEYFAKVQKSENFIMMS